MSSTGSAPDTLSSELRAATRGVHTASDKLVNLKLGVALANDDVWAEGLLVFYEVFSYLESALERRRDSLLGELRIAGATDARAAEFERDLDFYLGRGWRKTYQVRPQVREYLEHLKQVEEEEPYLLVAYVYHLYMGLLSGGQILRGKRKLLDKFKLSGGKKVQEEEEENRTNAASAPAGLAVTHFAEPIPVLKRKIKEATNRIGEELDEETRQKVVQEGVKVFQLNDSIIRSVRGVNDIFRRRMLWLAAVLGLVSVLAYYLWEAASR